VIHGVVTLHNNSLTGGDLAMLADPLVIKSLDPNPATAVTVLETNSYAMIDAGAGRSTRVCSEPTIAGHELTRPGKLSISHSVSNENSPVKTDRHLIRFDFIVEDLSGKEIKTYAYAVFGVPRGTFKESPNVEAAEVNSSLLQRALVGALTGALLASESAATFDESKFTRIIAGES